MSRLSNLLAARDRLQDEVVPLHERLGRCDTAIAELARATWLRDQLLEQHDQNVAAAIAYGRAAAPVDPALNLAEIALRKASGEARAAAKARADIVDELTAINGQLSAVQLDLEEAIWADYPRAAAGEFARAEEAQRAYEEALGRLHSLTDAVHRAAHVHANGRDPMQTPAMTAFRQLEAMTATLRGRLGLNAVQDLSTGPELLRAVSEGTAQLGDIARWQPQFQGVADGSANINRGTPQDALQRPPGGHLPNPAVAPITGEPANTGASPLAPIGEELPRWLEPSTPTFMPAPRRES